MGAIMLLNKINPKLLLNSKWTAIKPVNKEKHFIVTEVQYDEEGYVVHCLIEAVLTQRTEPIDWQQLKHTDCWQHGWK